MASLRKASSYSKGRSRPYTRKSKRRKKAFIKTVPGNRIVKYNMGNQKAFQDGKHKFNVSLVSTENVQIRDNALEAARQLLNKQLDKNIPGQYYFHIKVYPHNILRENKTAAGAGADRLSSGMKHSFGIVIGRAARVKTDQEVFFVSIEDEHCAQVAKKAMATVKAKFPCKAKIVYTKVE